MFHVEVGNIVQHVQHFRVLRQQRFFSAAVGAAQDQAFDPLRMTQSKLLGDHAAHRDAENIGLLDPQMVQQAGGIIGKHRHGVRSIRLLALTHPPVVKGNRPEGPGKAVHIPVPADRADGEAHNEEQRFTLALFFVVQLNTV